MELGDGDSGMNTKNILCSPFIHVLLMVVFLIFSLGCPASHDVGPAPKKDKADPAAAAATPTTTQVPAPDSAKTVETAKAPKRIAAEPASMSVAQDTPHPDLPPAAEQATTPQQAQLPPPETQAAPPAIETTAPSGEEERVNPLRSPSGPTPFPSDLQTNSGQESDAKPQTVVAVHESSQPAASSASPAASADALDPQPSLSKADSTSEVALAEPDQKPPAVSAEKQKAASPKELRPPIDLIGENGVFFKNWPKPEFALLITGKIEGYLEPCGCAGIERMKGGMGRRFMLFKQLREQGWPVVGMDVGGLAHGFGRQAEMKFHILCDGMRAMNYQAITLGETDLKLPAGELVNETANAQNQESAFISANVGLFGMNSGLIAKSRIIEAGGKKIGVTAVFGKSYQKEIQNSEIEFSDPEKAIKEVLPELQKKANVLVLLAHATMEESKDLAKKFPQFKVVVTSAGNAIPPDEPQKIEGSKTVFIEVGTKGMSAIVLGFYNDKEQPVRYQRVVLDSRQSFIDPKKQGIVSTAPSPPEIKNLMAAYQDQLKTIGWKNLGLNATQSYPQPVGGGKFVGTEKCKSCHEESYRVWKKSPHSQAFDTLAKLDPPRIYDPECISCHVVGWEPQRFYPYKSGYESPEKTPYLKEVGCEDCHGPCELHCKAEEGSDQKKMDLYRKAAVITKAESEKSQCATCHDGDNSPDFNFKKYWPYVEHYEKDK